MTEADRYPHRAAMLSIPAEELSDPKQLCQAPVVSVIMLAYNHADYIQQSVESVMDQVGVSLELLIGEDGSSDDTRMVCVALQRRFPHAIRLISSARNIGIESNFLRLLGRARGCYCAMLEGDDYWTVPDKLAIQVALLEAHPDLTWCGTRTANRLQWLPPQPRYNLREILRRYVVHTSSVVFRTACVERWPRFPAVICLDHLLFAILAEQGDCGFIDRETSYYRRHPGGVWSGASAKSRLTMTARCIDVVDDWLGRRYHQELTDRELWVYRMETTVNPDRSIGEQWRYGWIISRQALRRTLGSAPWSTLQLVGRVSLLPVTVLYLRVRRRVALRRRVGL